MRRLAPVVAIATIVALSAASRARDGLAATGRETRGAGVITNVSSDGSVGTDDERAATRSSKRSRAAERQALRQRLSEGEPGTYIGDILLDHDSALARWPERTETPLTVWVQPSSNVQDWQPEFVQEVREAFTDWERTGIPLRFRFIDDSADAEVHVTWRDHFREPISGKTLWARDDGWWIVEANISLAVHHNGGEPLDVVAMRAIALHEVGHVVGLDHTRDASNIMTPKVRVTELSSADRATARLLYSLPAGTVR